MSESITRTVFSNFLGSAPDWYKWTIIAFLVVNPFLLMMAGPVIAGWALILQFIFTLAMALKCYPLQPGGMLAMEAVIIGLTSPDTVMDKVESNLAVILLLIFMVAGIFFMKDLLLYIFSKILLRVRSKVLLSFLFCFTAAFLSAFLDALTVTAVVIAVGVGFYGIFHKVASGKGFDQTHDNANDDHVGDSHREDLYAFRSFLRSLLMHAAVGTALGGVCTLVGEPQNLVIAEKAGWEFGEFFLRMAPVTLPVFVVGLITCLFLEFTGWFGYGTKLPENVRKVMEDYSNAEDAKRTKAQKAALVAQALAALWLIFALGLHLAEVGLIGLTIIVLTTAFTGIVEEHRIGKAFEEALPFTALLTVFFAIVAVIYDQKLFTPVITAILSMDGEDQVAAFYLANGLLSAISDNVFVATVYIDEVRAAAVNGLINRDSFDLLSVAINTGTNIPSVATPNGQAAFLFLLTSALAPLIRLSYGRMVIMALPYTITMTITGLIMVYFYLQPATDAMYERDWINHHTVEMLSNPDKDSGH